MLATGLGNRFVKVEISFFLYEMLLRSPRRGRRRLGGGRSMGIRCREGTGGIVRGFRERRGVYVAGEEIHVIVAAADAGAANVVAA